MRDRGFDHESSVYEFPVTIEDESSPLADRIAKTLDVFAANADNGAPSVILIHTNDPDTKVAAEDTILNQLPRDIGVSDLTTFARFWRARDRLAWSVKPGRSPAETTIDAKSDELASGLTIEFVRAIASGRRSSVARSPPDRSA